MMPISRTTYKDLREFLERYCPTAETQREMLIHTAFYGVDALQRGLTYGGNNYEFVAQLLKQCESYGLLDGAHPSVAVLEELRRGFLAGRTDEINGLIARIRAETTPVGIPPIVSPVGTPPVASVTAISAAELTRRTLQIIPPPFEWIEIPAGWVSLEPGGYIPKGRALPFNVPSFMIAKYPITNAQYAPFMAAGGYTNKAYWTEAGWAQRLKGGDFDVNWKWVETGKAWTAPTFWNDAKWNGDEQPVVGVSWYEAIAFSHWLNSTLKPENNLLVTVPTEQQWQRAAQSDDKRLYPWGNDFDPKRCNIADSNIGKTTPVRQYQGKGDSPYGVLDMAGNVWEWCLTQWDSGEIGLGNYPEGS
jgi:hypothetical protein